MLKRTRTRDIRQREKVRLRVRPLCADIHADRSRSQVLHPSIFTQCAGRPSSSGLVQRVLNAGKGLLSRVRRRRARS
jgi:hypothetical protein